MTVVRGIPADQVEPWWPVLIPYFENFAERSQERLSVQGLVDDVRDRERQVWVAGDVESGVSMVALTRVVTEPTGATTVHIDCCAGHERDNWFEALSNAVRDWAKALGARRVFTMARPGWARELKPIGWRETHRELMLEVVDG